MREYVEKLIKNKPPPNNGYNYITTETVAIPVHRVTLGISKRCTTSLELVEEMVLRFASIGINDLDMIAGSLGLPRDILDITVGDLHVKSLAYHSSGKCVLMPKGRDVLKNLAISERKKDMLQNVYVNAVTGEIYGERNKDYIDSRVQNDIKMKHKIDANSIDLYRRNMNSIGIIFEQSIKTYLDDNMKTQDELVSIDSVDDLSTGFIMVPIHIYVSESGLDIDIVARNRRQKAIVEVHKDLIIEQMRSRKLLSNLFIYTHNDPIVPIRKSGISCDEQYRMLQSILSDDTISDFDTQAYRMLITPRELLDDELLGFCEILFSDAKTIEIQIDKLNYWSKNPKFLTICSYVSQKTQCHIVYCNSSNDVSSSVRRICNSCPNIPAKNIQKSEHNAWFKIIVDSKIEVNIQAELVKVFSHNQYIPRIIACVS